MGKRRSKSLNIFSLICFLLVAASIVLFCVPFLTITQNFLTSTLTTSVNGFEFLFGAFIDKANINNSALLLARSDSNQTTTTMLSVFSILTLLFACAYLVAFVLRLFGIGKKSKIRLISLILATLLMIGVTACAITLASGMHTVALGTTITEGSTLAFLPLIPLVCASIITYLKP